MQSAAITDVGNCNEIVGHPAFSRPSKGRVVGMDRPATADKSILLLNAYFDRCLLREAWRVMVMKHRVEKCVFVSRSTDRQQTVDQWRGGKEILSHSEEEQRCAVLGNSTSSIKCCSIIEYIISLVISYLCGCRVAGCWSWCEERGKIGKASEGEGTMHLVCCGNREGRLDEIEAETIIAICRTKLLKASKKAYFL